MTYEQAREKLNQFEVGWLECLYLYAHMTDGVYYVGTTGRTGNAAARSFLQERGHSDSVIDALYPMR